ncbi:winged helix-turn-helix domain-containing protein [Pseudomonas wenzhouensis]|nr:winged helix-turn-helix domain-containing protein [Pseudomonas wenzhouensis]MDM9653829.1 winged helix-turn-helix domain-containing protein [Pseudomonas wenzhouensis]
MAIPDFQSVMRPVLATVQNGAPLPLNELRERVADQFQLTDDERKERLPSGHQTVINNRVGWARTYLTQQPPTEVGGLVTYGLKVRIRVD